MTHLKCDHLLTKNDMIILQKATKHFTQDLVLEIRFFKADQWLVFPSKMLWVLEKQ